MKSQPNRANVLRLEKTVDCVLFVQMTWEG